MTAAEQCYMCNAVACSREHVPPRNLFPECKDIGGTDYRKNLITVPSCEMHNSAKSHDDEFLMVSLAGIVGSNSVGYMHKLGKVNRAIRRSAGRLLEKAVRNPHRVDRIELSSNHFLEVIWGTPDAERLKKCFDHIARGLYFHHFGARFMGRTKVHLGYLQHNDRSSRDWNAFIQDKTELELAGKPLLGANPEVFAYQMTDKDQFGLFLVRLRFYGGLHVYVAYLPLEDIPRSLEFELMNRGIKTIFTLGDKQYEIN